MAAAFDLATVQYVVLFIHNGSFVVLCNAL